MGWIESNTPDRIGAIETVVSRTAIIPATLDQASLYRLAELILYPSNLGLQGLFVKATDYISRIMYVPFRPTPTDDNILNLTLPGSSMFESIRINTNINIQFLSPDKQLYAMGEYKVDRYFNNFADYNGYTKIDIYLPYYGFVSVNPNDVLDKYIIILLGFDALSGQGTYYVCCSKSHLNESYSTNPISNNANTAYCIANEFRILSTHTTMLGCEIPLGSTNAGEVVRNMLLGAVKMAGTALLYNNARNSGAFKTKTVNTETTTTQVKNTKGKKPTNRLTTVSKETTESERITNYGQREEYYMKSECFSTAMSSLSSMHLNAASDKPNSLLAMCDGSVKVQIVIYRPKIKEIDSNYKHLYGVPMGDTSTLASVSGYTEISSIHIEGDGFKNATKNEITHLEKVISNGIIL